MSSREQFEAWAEKNGHDIYRSGIDGAYYFQSTQWSWDIWQAATSTMEDKYAALTAENDNLVNFITDKHWCASDCLPETPSTDAFLAEVRAQGVEMFARSLRGEAEITKVCTFKPVQQFEEFAYRADECAAKLRQDAAQ